MMKIVPASRLVTEASPEPPTRLPSSDRRRAIRPEGEAVADSVSITATAVHPRNTPRGGVFRAINYSLRFGWAGASGRWVTWRLQAAILPRRQRIGRLETPAEMGEVGKSAGQSDLRDGFPRQQGIEQIAPGFLEPPRPDPLADRRIFRMKQILQIAR